MIFTINFNDKTFGNACKVCNHISNNMLAAEFGTQSIVCQYMPKYSFSLGRIKPHFFGVLR